MARDRVPQEKLEGLEKGYGTQLDLVHQLLWLTEQVDAINEALLEKALELPPEPIRLDALGVGPKTAARVLYGELRPNGAPPWEELPPTLQERWVRRAEADRWLAESHAYVQLVAQLQKELHAMQVVVAFLDGSGPLRTSDLDATELWYGAVHAGPPFWWRRQLRARWKALLAAAKELEPVVLLGKGPQPL